MKKDVLDAIDQNYMEKEEEGEASYKTVTGKEATSAHKMYEKSMETEPKGACRPTTYIKQTRTLKRRFLSTRVLNEWH